MSLHIVDFPSQVLQGNPLKDPTTRKLYVYLPPGGKTTGLPALLALNGFTGTGAMFFSGSPFLEGLDARLDRLITTGQCPPCLVIAPDCFTRVGGSQYLNSSATGNYLDYVVKEIVPYINKEFAPSAWGVFGKSSGGFGSMILGMEFPEIFQAIGNHSGDSNFELCYSDGFYKALDKFRAAGGPAKWLEKFWDPKEPQNRKDIHTLDKLAMSACYSPNPKSPHMGIDFPFDLETGEFRQDVWEKWRQWDPVVRMERRVENMKKLRFAYVDCGTKDEFSLHWGCRTIASKLKKLGVETIHEEFSDTHMSVSYRLDRSLPLLVKSLS